MARTSPEGTAVWPYLNKPDKDFDKETGIYHTKLSVSASDAEDTIVSLEKFLQEAYIEHCKTQERKKLRFAGKPWSDEVDKEGNNTGKIVFKFKMKAKTVSGIDLRPILVDSDRNPMSDLIGGGSTMIVSYEPRHWYVPSLGVGMTLGLKGVQVLELKQYTGGTSLADMGFEKRDGFKTSTTPEQGQKERETEAAIQSHSGGDF